jgi:hypothetical protein
MHVRVKIDHYKTNVNNLQESRNNMVSLCIVKRKKTLTQNEIILEIPHYGVATSIASKHDVRYDYYPIVFLHCPWCW